MNAGDEFTVGPLTIRVGPHNGDFRVASIWYTSEKYGGTKLITRIESLPADAFDEIARQQEEYDRALLNANYIY